MKNFYSALLVLAFGVSGFSQVVNIPDANFKARLLAANTTNGYAHDLAGNPIVIDANGNGQIEVPEALQVGTLSIYYVAMSNATGLQAFANLTDLYGGMNYFQTIDLSALSDLKTLTLNSGQLTSINLSANTALEQVEVTGQNIVSLTLSGLPNLVSANFSNNDLTDLALNGLPALETLDVRFNQLSAISFTGVPQLKSLDIMHNQFAAIDVSAFTQLEYFSCQMNQLTSLQLTGLNNLTQVNCGANQISSLDIALPSLIYFYCDNNQLTALDVSASPLLNYLGCSQNQLNALDLTANPELEWLNFSQNQFTDFDFSTTPNLNTLYISGNQFTSIDLSLMPQLSSFSCASNLFTQIDASMVPVCYMDCRNNPNLEWLNVKNGAYVCDGGPGLDNNPSLTYICADEEELDDYHWMLDYYGMDNVVLNTYCSNAPGGNFNTITGRTPFDENADGCDPGDTSRRYVKIVMDDGTTQGAAFINGAGNYTFFTQAGNFALSTQFENPAIFSVSPASANVTFADANNNVATQDFCVAAQGVHPDLYALVSNAITTVPGTTIPFHVWYGNKGNQLQSGTLQLQFDESVIDFISSVPAPTSIASGVLSYDFADLYPLENRRIEFVFDTNSPSDTPPLNIGDDVPFTATVSPVTGDDTPGDNTFTGQLYVMGSYDPNDKTCLEGEVVSSEKIGDYLHYLVRFENTGNAAAQNVVIKDVIDASQFDVSSFQLLSASHDLQANLSGNRAEFGFYGIQLAPEATGFVLFKIKTLPSLTVGTTVSNKADIFFDYNFPITTNEAQTTFQQLSVGEVGDLSVSLYPNPAKTDFTVKADSEIRAVQIFDLGGRLLETHLGSSVEVNVGVGGKASGIYFVKIVSEKGTSVQKLVKE